MEPSNNLPSYCRVGDLDLVSSVLASGGGVNIKDDVGMTGLMGAVKNNHNSIVRLLLEQPTVDLNCVDKCGNTALHHAVFSGNVEGVQLLLADHRLTSVNGVNFIGRTPVMSAIYVENENCLRELVSHPSVDLDMMTMIWGDPENMARWEIRNNSFSPSLLFCHRRRGFVEGERIVAEAREKRRQEQGDI